MKRFYTLISLVMFVLLYADVIHAQPSKDGLNQAELLKQFSGTWENKSIKDTVYTAEFKSYGNNGGLEFNLKGATAGKVWLEMRQFWGYDKKLDRIVMAGLMKNSPDMMLSSAVFKTSSRFEQVPLEFASNPEKAGFLVVFEIKSPDQVIREEYMNNKPLGTEIYNRVKN
jgi:hypothetical protein